MTGHGQETRPRRDRRRIVAVSIVLLLVLAAAAFIALHLPTAHPPDREPALLDDASTLALTRVGQIVEVRSREDVAAALRAASGHGLQVSIGGKRHSMGGHTLYPESIHLDMTGFNRVLSIEPAARVVVVESGATWKDVQDTLDVHGMAVIAMQGPNIFTVGGSISVNAHGWDTREQQLSQTVQWFDLMLADGRVLRCSNQENRELFGLVQGGFGLFGVILEVGLRVTDNTVYGRTHQRMTTSELPGYFREILAAPDLEMVSANLSIQPGSLLRSAVTAEYRRSGVAKLGSSDLGPERFVLRDRFFLHLSRRYDWGKDLRWFLENRVAWQSESGLTRNDAMRAPFKRLMYYSDDDVDILQEYFIPYDRFEEFADGLRAAIQFHGANLLNVTIRYVSPNGVPYLNYAKEESLAFVLYFNVQKSRAGTVQDSLLTDDLVNLACDLGGTFYLPYRAHYSLEQIRRAYPEIDDFFALKRKYDSAERFRSLFYERYGTN